MTKRPEEIALMAQSGKLLACVFGHLDGLNMIGMSTMQINDRHGVPSATDVLESGDILTSSPS